MKLTFFFFTTSSILLLNSLFNPVIYCVRIKHFRTAFIEMVLRNNSARADEFQMPVYTRQQQTTHLFNSEIKKGIITIMIMIMIMIITITFRLEAPLT